MRIDLYKLEDILQAVKKEQWSGVEVCYCSVGLKYRRANVGLRRMLHGLILTDLAEVHPNRISQLAPVSHDLLRRVVTRGTIRQVLALSCEL